MLPLIFRAGDGTNQIFLPSHPSTRMRGLFCLKKIGDVGAGIETKYCIEFKSERSANTQEILALIGRRRHFGLPFLLKCTKTERLQSVQSRAIAVNSCGVAPSSFYVTAGIIDNHNKNNVICLYCIAPFMSGKLLTNQSIFKSLRQAVSRGLKALPASIWCLRCALRNNSVSK